MQNDPNQQPQYPPQQPYYQPAYYPPPQQPQNWFQRMPLVAKIIFILGALLLLICCISGGIGFTTGFVQGLQHLPTPTP